MAHRVVTIGNTGPKILLLHPAGVTCEQFAALVGPMPGFICLYADCASALLRWDHLGNTDAPYLLTIQADFIAGYSSGAFMTAEMLERADYAGAMMLAGGFINILKPRPTPLMLVHGTEDAQVPYEGTANTRGATATAAEMRSLLRISTAVRRRRRFDGNGTDGCFVYRDNWRGLVKLYTVNGGGHTWPIGDRVVFQPADLGRVSKDIDASIEMGKFFDSLS